VLAVPSFAFPPGNNEAGINADTNTKADHQEKKLYYFADGKVGRRTSNFCSFLS
jgi:hypothetical protein